MTQAQTISAEDRPAAGMLRFVNLAKNLEWQVRDLPWDDLPPIPELRATASPRRRAMHSDIWRSVLMQQLQADLHAVEMAAQLLRDASDHEARLYYSTMVQDESRHTEAWLRLIEELGEGERNPHFDRLVHIFFEAETIEEKIFLMQVFFERLIIPLFQKIAKASRGTVLEDLCRRLMKDDAIHHRSGVAYEKILLAGATSRTKNRVVATAKLALPIFVAHALWRPEARAFARGAMEAHDRQQLMDDLQWGIKMGTSLGLDFSEVSIPVF